MKLKKSLVLVCPGFALLCAVCHGQQMGFGGPAVLSGGGGAVGRTAGNAPISLRPYLGVDARYDSNLGDPSDTTKLNDHAYGLTGTWGLYGLRRGDGYILAVDYHGLYRQYAGSKRNGVSHFGTMNYVQQLGPTTDMYASGGVSIYRYGLNGYRTALIPAEVLPDVGDPDSEVFDSATHAYRASIGIRKVMSSRVAVQFGGDGFDIRRPHNLISSRGGNGNASISYALGPHRNVGATYQYNYHFFPNGYGQTTMHNLSANFNQQLSPSWYFTGSVGVLRAENDRLVSVQLDPEIAELTGQNATLEAQHRVTFRPIYRIMFTKRLENGSLSIFYRRSSSPGNGFVISSLRENWGAAYGHTMSDKWHFAASFTGDSHVGVTQTISRYTTLGGGVAVNYRFYKSLHLNARTDYRHWVVAGAPLKRDRVAVMVGLIFSPGDLPLSIW